MSIIIENIQKKIEYTTEIEELVNSVLNTSLQTEQFEFETEISVLLVDNEQIREINLEQRDIDKPTDVLSFPIVEMEEGEIKENIGDYDLESDELLLGDIVISLEKVKEQAEEYGHSFERELAFLVTHGFFHLLGYDHENTAQEQKMIAKQERILSLLRLTRNQDEYNEK
jgi:probable rRNA maturation factor